MSTAYTTDHTSSSSYILSTTTTTTTVHNKCSLFSCPKAFVLKMWRLVYLIVWVYSAHIQSIYYLTQYQTTRSILFRNYFHSLDTHFFSARFKPKNTAHWKKSNRKYYCACIIDMYCARRARVCVCVCAVCSLIFINAT